MMFRGFTVFFLLVLLVLSYGCVSSLFPAQSSSETPVPTTTPALLQTPVPTALPTLYQNGAAAPTVTPAPATNPSIAGVGGWLSWVSRNASGDPVTDCHYTVYDWKILNGSYHWQSRYSQMNFQQSPPAGMKWIFIWVNGWCNSSQVPSANLPKDFRIRYGGQVYSPSFALEGGNGRDELPLLISETRTHSTLSVIKGYWDGGPKYTTDPYGYRDSVSQDLLLSGRSNAWDGWMLFAIPSAARYQDLLVTASSGDAGVLTWDFSNETSKA